MTTDKEPRLGTFERALHDANELYKKQVARADNEFPKIQKIEPVKASFGFNGLSYMPVIPNSYYGSNKNTTEEHWNKSFHEFEGKATLERIRINKIHEANIDKLASNLALKAKVRKLFAEIGMVSMYYGSTVVRNKVKSTEELAGWTKDLDRQIVTDDGHAYSIRAIDEAVKKAKEAVEKEIRRIKDLAAEAEKQRLAELETQELMYIRAKYNAGPSATPDEVLECMTQKCKYLHLAHTMFGLRSGQTDDDYLDAALNRFRNLIVVDDSYQDQAIYSDAFDAFVKFRTTHDWRNMRDNEWNFNRIFELVEPTLYADYIKIRDLIEE